MAKTLNAKILTVNMSVVVYQDALAILKEVAFVILLQSTCARKNYVVLEHNVELFMVKKHNAFVQQNCQQVIQPLNVSLVKIIRDGIVF